MKQIAQLDIMRYYVAYHDIEKNIIHAIQNKKNAIPAFHYYMSNYMKIARNFKSNMAEKILSEVENLIQTNIKVEELSNILVSKNFVSRNEIKQVEVAASKILWLYKPETIIMDNNNKNVLNKVKNYKEYVTEWNTLFEIKVKEIDEQLKNFSIQDPIIYKKWFKMRVFDMYLLSIYSENNLKY